MSPFYFVAAAPGVDSLTEPECGQGVLYRVTSNLCKSLDVTPRDLRKGTGSSKGEFFECALTGCNTMSAWA